MDFCESGLTLASLLSLVGHLFVYGRISGSAGSMSSAFSFPHNSVTVGLILFKFGRCMQ